MMFACQDSIYSSCKYLTALFSRDSCLPCLQVYIWNYKLCALFFGSFLRYSLKSLPKTLNSTNAFTFNLVLIYVFFNNFFNSIPAPLSDASSKAFTEPAASGCGTTTGPVPIS